jgi:hypothetical protein
LKNIQTLCSLLDADLIGCETIAIDGTKSRAHTVLINQNDKHVIGKTQEYLDAGRK